MSSREFEGDRHIGIRILWIGVRLAVSDGFDVIERRYYGLQDFFAFESARIET